MIAEQLYQLLQTGTALSGLVADRIFPHIVPQRSGGLEQQMPCATYRIDGTERGRGYCGTDAVSKVRFSVSSFALTLLEAQEVADAARGSVMDFSGDIQGVHFKDVQLDNEFSTEEMEPGLFRVEQQYTAWVKES